MSEHPREKAETIRKFARNYRKANIDFDRSGAEWLDGFIDWLRDEEADLHNERRTFALGSFFGVCIIETVGGRWAVADGGWKLVLDSPQEIDPFRSARLHLQRGRRYSVLQAFEAISTPARLGDEPRDQPDRRWTGL